MDRKPEFPINSVFLNRKSAYSLTGESISHEQLMRLFEAARWAPSSYNGQPWRFIYATRESDQWQTFLNLLIDFNKQWAQYASALVVVVSRENFEFNNQPSKTHSFDAGSAWENLALQATFDGLVAHGMEGFDYERARTELNIPAGYKVEAMIAIGKHGENSKVPQDLITREKHVSERKPLDELVFEGSFKKE